MALWTEFPDELDRSALTLVLDAWRGHPIDTDRAALAAFNIAGYGYRQYSGQPPMVGTVDTENNAEVEAAFQAVLDETERLAAAKANPDAPTVQAFPIPWGLIISVALKILQRRFS